MSLIRATDEEETEWIAYAILGMHNYGPWKSRRHVLVAAQKDL